jgi:hypothetical protein
MKSKIETKMNMFNMNLPVLCGCLPEGHSKSCPYWTNFSRLNISIIWHNKLTCTSPARLFANWHFSSTSSKWQVSVLISHKLLCTYTRRHASSEFSSNMVRKRKRKLVGRTYLGLYITLNMDIVVIAWLILGRIPRPVLTPSLVISDGGIFPRFLIHRLTPTRSWPSSPLHGMQ